MIYSWLIWFTCVCLVASEIQVDLDVSFFTDGENSGLNLTCKTFWIATRNSQSPIYAKNIVLINGRSDQKIFGMEFDASYDLQYCANEFAQQLGVERTNAKCYRSDGILTVQVLLSKLTEEDFATWACVVSYTVPGTGTDETAVKQTSSRLAYDVAAVSTFPDQRPLKFDLEIVPLDRSTEDMVTIGCKLLGLNETLKVGQDSTSTGTCHSPDDDEQEEKSTLGTDLVPLKPVAFVVNGLSIESDLFERSSPFEKPHCGFCHNKRKLIETCPGEFPIFAKLHIERTSARVFCKFLNHNSPPVIIDHLFPRQTLTPRLIDVSSQGPTLMCPHSKIFYLPWTNATLPLPHTAPVIHPETFLAVYKEIQCGEGEPKSAVDVLRDYRKKTCSSLQYGLDVFRINETHSRCTVLAEPPFCAPIIGMVFFNTTCDNCLKNGQLLYLDSAIPANFDARRRLVTCIVLARNKEHASVTVRAPFKTHPSPRPHLSYIASTNGDLHLHCMCIEHACRKITIESQQVDPITGKLRQHTKKYIDIINSDTLFGIYGANQSLFTTRSDDQSMSVSINKKAFDDITHNGTQGMALSAACETSENTSLPVDISFILVRTYANAHESKVFHELSDSTEFIIKSHENWNALKISLSVLVAIGSFSIVLIVACYVLAFKRGPWVTIAEYYTVTPREPEPAGEHPPAERPPDYQDVVQKDV